MSFFEIVGAVRYQDVDFNVDSRNTWFHAAQLAGYVMDKTALPGEQCAYPTEAIAAPLGPRSTGNALGLLWHELVLGNATLKPDTASRRTKVQHRLSLDRTIYSARLWLDDSEKPNVYNLDPSSQAWSEERYRGTSRENQLFVGIDGRNLSKREKAVYARDVRANGAQRLFRMPDS